MPRRKIVIPSFNGVAAGESPTCTISVGPRFHAVFLRYKGTANQATIEADIAQIRVKINGKVQRTFSPEELYKIYALNGYAFQAGIIPIFFSEPWRRNVSGEDTLAWGTDGVDSFQIEVDLDAGAVAPTLSGFAVVDDVKAKLLNIIKWRRQTIPNSAIGPLDINTLSKKKGNIYQRMHCFETAAGDIGGVDIEVDSTKIYNQTDQDNDSVLAMQGMSPQADTFHIIFDETQRIEDGLPLSNLNTGDKVQDFNVRWDMTAANGFTLLTELRGAPE